MNPQEIFGMMGGGGMMGGMDISEMFGGGGGTRGERKRRGRDVGIRMEVPLELLYSGGKKVLNEKKTVLCPQCKGTGNKHGKKSTCSDCKGRGAKLVQRMLGPGMVTQMQVPCDTCNGQGNEIKEKDKCKDCDGQRIKEVDRKLTVRIQPGMADQTQIPFEGEGDQHPDIDIPGSIVVVLQQEKNDKFTRQGDDLIINHTVSLSEALLGCCFELRHLDNRLLYIKTPAGKIITPDLKMTLKGEGMPCEGRPGKGDLHVNFSLEFPRTLAEDQVEMLQKIFPKTKKPTKGTDEHEECFMDDYTHESWKQIAKFGEEEEEDDEDEGGGGVRCAHQ